MNGYLLQYLPDVASWAGRTSVQACLLIALILALQIGLRTRLAPRWRYALWLLLMLRLAMPWLPESSFSAYNLISFAPRQQQETAEAAQFHEDGESSPLAATGASMPAATGTGAMTTGAGPGTAPDSQPPRASLMLIVWHFVPVIWLCGVVLVLGAAIAQSAAMTLAIRRQRFVTDQDTLALLEDCKQEMGVCAYLALVETERVSSPALFGIVRPRLLLPKSTRSALSPEQLRHVFLHELAHLQRRDIAINWFMTLLQALHWFNPLVWYAFAQMRADQELACDALALSHAQPDEVTDYGRTFVYLLEKYAQPRRLPSLAGVLEKQSHMKRRITMIARFHELSGHRAWPAILLLLGLGAVSLTGAQTSQQAASPAGSTGAPVVVKLEPANGATSVDPATTTLSVTFDQPMGGGMSWVGSPPTFPEGSAKPVWSADRKTCTMTAKLKPGQQYTIGINSQSHKNFTNTSRVPVEPMVWSFTTGGTAAELQAMPKAPVVATLSPANAATNVDPATSSISITFDQPMSSGMSWCGGGPTFPESQGQAVWSADKKTCTMNVKLKPAQQYSIGINSQSYRNFASEAGIPVQPVVWTFTTGGTAAQLQAMPKAPVVTAVSPANGATTVDAGTRQISITFDQPMSSGMSWCGGGPTFPESQGQAVWSADKKTCTMNVKLKPAQQYMIGINSQSYRNFASEAGIPVQPVVWTFTTAGTAAEMAAMPKAPTVTTLSPANGAADVDPATKTISVTFDQPMGAGMSWCGGGPTYPKSPGQPVWSADKKTCTMTVELTPDHEYMIGVNSPSYRNFMSTAGIPVEPVLWKFKTKQ